MKRGQFIKKGLAVALSAAMAFSMAPDVGLFSMPAKVLAANLNDSIVSIEGPDGSSTDPKFSTNGGYYVSASKKLIIGANDTAGVDLTIKYVDGIADSCVVSVAKLDGYGVSKEDDEYDDITATVGTMDPTENTAKINIKTSGAKVGSKYTLKIDDKKIDAADPGNDVEIEVEIGYVVKYDYEIEGVKVDLANEGYAAKVQTATDGKFDYTLFSGTDDFVMSTSPTDYTNWYRYEDYTVNGAKTRNPGDKIALDQDTTISVNWKKGVTVPAITQDQAKKKYDGTKNWSAVVDGTALANAEGERTVKVKVTGTYPDKDVDGSANQTITITDAVIDESVANADEYSIVANPADPTVGQIVPITITKNDIDASGVVISKTYNGKPLTQSDELATNVTGKCVTTINGESVELDMESSNYLVYTNTNLTDAEKIKAGSFDMSVILKDDANGNYVFADGAKTVTGLTGTIEVAKKNFSFGEMTYMLKEENTAGVITYDVVESDGSTSVASAAESIPVGDFKTACTGVGVSEYDVAPENSNDYDLFSTSTSISGTNLTFKFNANKVAEALKNESKKTIRINMAAKGSGEGDFDITGYVDLTLISGDIAAVTATSSTQKYAGDVTNVYTIASTSGDIKDKVKNYTTITYTDASGADITEDVENGLIPVSDDNKNFMNVVVNGGGYYGTGRCALAVTAGDFVKENFSTDTTELVYGDDEPEFYFVDPTGLGHEVGANDFEVTTVKYASKIDGSDAAAFSAITKPEDSAVYYPVIEATSNAANYTDVNIGTKKILTDCPIIIYAEAPEKTDIATVTVSGLEKEYVFEDKAILPDTYKLVDGDYELVEGTDFEVEYGENNAVGEGTITFKGIGLHYEGERTENFTIKEAEKSDEEKAAEALAAAEAAANAYIAAANNLPQTKDAVTDTAKADSDIAAAKALAPTEAQMALLDDETKAKVEAAAAQIATAEKAVADKKADNNKENEQPAPTPSTDTTTGSSTDVTPSNGGSGGSGGGSGSSNAKTVKNADGSTTTTTTTAKGTIETTTKTNADGSKTTSKVVKNKDGSGSVTETSVSAAGTTKVVEVVTDTTGAATEVTTTVSNSKGASMKVTYAAKGTAITVSKVETTGKTAVSIPATVKVGGKTYKVTKIAASALKGNKEITKVTLGKNVKSIGKNAFNGDSKLKTIVMKKAPTTVGKNAFKGIAKKATIKIKATKKAFKTAKSLIKKSGVASTVKIKRAK